MVQIFHLVFSKVILNEAACKKWAFKNKYFLAASFAKCTRNCLEGRGNAVVVTMETVMGKMLKQYEQST